MYTRLIFSILILFVCFQTNSQNIVINEINYRSPGDSNVEFIELYNNELTAVDLSGWSLTKGVEYAFQSGTSISGGGYIVIAAEPATVNSTFGGTILGPFTGKLSNNGDEVRLLDAACIEVDKVAYESWDEWPCVRHANNGDGLVSIQLINSKLPGNQPGSWSSGYPSPNNQNSQVYSANASIIPVIKNVSKKPDKPLPNEAVTIKAEFSENAEVFSGPINVSLEYQINKPGSYTVKSEISWTTIPMLDNGIDPDSSANNSIYTAKIPGSLNEHRNLVRFRVKVTSASGGDKIYPDPRFKESNFAYYVYGNYPDVNTIDINGLDTLPDVSIITKNSIANMYIGGSNGTNTATSQYQGNELLGEGTLIYNGKVFDHINFRPRGKGSRLVRDKPGIKLGLNKENPISLKSDCGESYDVKRDKLIFSGGWVNDIASHGLTESLIYKLNELTGSLPRHTDYVQMRIVDNELETGNEKGDFFGLYILMEDYNGDYLAEHDFAEGNFWGTNRTTRNRFLDYSGDFPNAESIGTFAPSTQTNSSFTITNKGNKSLLFGDRIAAEIYGMNGNNYIGKHSYNEYYDSATDSYLGWWGDMDNSFGSPYDDVTVYPRADAKIDAPNAGHMIIPNTMQIEFQSEFRSTYDLLLDYTDPDCNCTQSDYLVDQESRKIYNSAATHNWVDVDKSRWPQINYDLGSYAAHRDWYKSWFKDRKTYLTSNFSDIDIPSKPSISLTGSVALDDIKFQNSAFSDLQGAGTFAAMEWRVGEWSDPSNSYYDQTGEPKYEIETKWRSGEMTSFSSSYQIPAEAKLKEDRTYLIRVRYKDTSGRWSHWSNPVKIIPTPASNPIQYDLVINEIMYNPSEPSQAEFIEIYNASNTTVSLDNVQFNEGIEYEFDSGQTMAPESYICIAKDSSSFFKAYGYYPFADYGGGLSNSGELVRLVGPFRTLIDTVRYDDNIPWPGTPDKGHYSLALKDPSMDNGIGSNWDIQSIFTTPCRSNEFNDFGDHGYSGIVINEIHYNPFDEVDPNSNVIESGTSFEFLELKNISNSDIDMTGNFFSRGIEYYFEPGTIIKPNEFFVLAEDKSSFFDRYGFEAHDKYDGKLSNSGETIWLVKSNGLILDELIYTSSFPWDSEANNGIHDYSLALINGDVDNNSWLNWKVQCTQDYTPGAENDFGCFPGLNYSGLTINEILYQPSGGSDLEFIEIVNNSDILINLQDVAITGGIQYVFDNILIPPKFTAPSNYIVIANDSTAFHNAYGFAPTGEFTGVISNLGEEIKLQDLFGETIDVVHYSNGIPWDSNASSGNRSLALLDPDLDNADPASWCVQSTDFTPKAINSFSDSDNDNVIDCLDQCPGVDDALVSTPCDDGDPCTTGEFFDSSCNCTGGVFTDSDLDGVCNALDQCAGSDDSLDLNANGIPDGCELCPNDLLEQNNVEIVADTSANNTILSNGRVLNGSIIDYHAGESVELISGFEVNLGAVFHAYIEPCSN